MENKTLSITSEEMQYINGVLMNMPYLHAAPIVNFFNVVTARRQQEEQQEQAKQELKNAFVTKSKGIHGEEDSKGFTQEGPTDEKANDGTLGGLTGGLTGGSN